MGNFSIVLTLAEILGLVQANGDDDDGGRGCRGANSTTISMVQLLHLVPMVKI